MRQLTKFQARLLAASMLTYLPTQTALAQTATPPASSTSTDTAADIGNDIVVTGTRRSTSLQTTPINIAAVSQEQIQNQRIDDIRSLARFVPGITMVDQGPRSQSQLIVRGISANSALPIVTQNNAVATYLGEVPLFVDFKLIDMDRVEILLGPQGTLYGAGTLAGAVRYLPNRPDATGLSVEAHSRVYDLAHSKGVGVIGDVAINIPILSDRIAFRTATGYYTDPGFIDAPLQVLNPGVSLPQPDLNDPAATAANLKPRSDINDERTFTTRNSLLVRPMDGLQAILTYGYQQTRTNGRQDNSDGILGTGRYENGTRIPEKMNREAQMFALEINADLGEFAQLTSSTAYTKQSFEYNRDLTDELLSYEYGYELFPSFTAISDQVNRLNQLVQEVRINSATKGPLTWVVGGYYNRARTANQYFEFTPGLPQFLGISRPDNLEFAARSTTRNEEKAGFAEASYHITPKWQVTGGIRYYDYSAFGEGGQAVPLYTPFPSIVYSNRAGQTSANGLVYKANSSYEISRDVFAYATYSTGYRIGGINRVAPCPDVLPTQGTIACALVRELSYKPDKTTNIEVGVRTSLLDRRLNINLSAYHIDWTDVQINSTTTYGNIGILANAGAAVSNGFELTVNARPTSRLSLNASYGYTDAHLTKDAPLLVRGQYTSFSGDRLPQSPRHSGSLIAVYDYPLANNAHIVGNWAATYTGDTLSTTGARGFGEKIPGYLLNRASFTYRNRKWEIGLFSDNIFNKYYATGIAEYRDNIATVNGYALRFYGKTVGRPRTIGLDGRIRF